MAMNTASQPDIGTSDERAQVRAVVCYSGGVDSTLLAALVLEEVDPADVRVVLASSFLMDAAELRFAREQASELGFPFVEIEHPGVQLPEVLTNLPNRCYVCKKALFTYIRELYPHAVIYCGENKDDTAEDRPGERAIGECDIRTPLLDAEMTKADVREAARELKLPAADHPSNSCYATRFPTGATITPELVHQAALIENAERAVHPDAKKIRARCHDVGAREFDVEITY